MGKTFFNLRTGSHTRQEGEVWKEYDGPDFDGYFKCVRHNGELVREPASQEEYYAWLDGTSAK